jgi:hypothetical protein
MIADEDHEPRFPFCVDEADADSSVSAAARGSHELNLPLARRACASHR